MDRDVILTLAVWIFLICLTIWFHIWWYDNGPYCCTHMCGMTHSMLECWSEVVCIILLIITVTFPTSWIIVNIRNK